ncbi:hypothetical protein MHZ36_13890 [Staphylococcus sp. ACRSN]|uniref:hypothetical protein n=1 Tax=Staphylococcus sp. ACRSN TaxID=2918214 RepID=UPI001EF2C283|nr:hypothetical protein [Staphylococcus sp. ACRSN]MCG7340350.1 hypothetical protein [Staphylococcus sp. ACRSN]
MNEPSKNNLDNKLAIAWLVIVYLLFMFGAYIVLDYIIQGKYRNLAPNTTETTWWSMGKDEALVYLGNISIGVMVIVIILVIVVNIFMVLLVIGGIKDRKRK